jgi:hypothetical protein
MTHFFSCIKNHNKIRYFLLDFAAKYGTLHGRKVDKAGLVSVQSANTAVICGRGVGVLGA